jgi:hypothetical protein
MRSKKDNATLQNCLQKRQVLQEIMWQARVCGTLHFPQKTQSSSQQILERQTQKALSDEMF